MSVEGIWTGEVYGPFGWENRGVFMLENGRIVGGDNRQYSIGTYSVSGDQIKAELHVYYYGPPRTSFGEKSEQFSLNLEGTFRGDQITGTVNRPDKSQLALQQRFTKRMDLPTV